MINQLISEIQSGDESGIRKLRELVGLVNTPLIELNGLSLVEKAKANSLRTEYRDLKSQDNISPIKLDEITEELAGIGYYGKENSILAHMSFALSLAGLSRSNKRQVGAILVKNNSVIAEGYNGTPAGDDNRTENEYGVTLSNVYHAENNALAKLITSSETSIGATLFVTDAPCIRCAEDLVRAKIAKVFYLNDYNNSKGIEYLRSHNIPVDKFSDYYGELKSTKDLKRLDL